MNTHARMCLLAAAGLLALGAPPEGAACSDNSRRMVSASAGSGGSSGRGLGASPAGREECSRAAVSTADAKVDSVVGTAIVYRNGRTLRLERDCPLLASDGIWLHKDSVMGYTCSASGSSKQINATTRAAMRRIRCAARMPAQVTEMDFQGCNPSGPASTPSSPASYLSTITPEFDVRLVDPVLSLPRDTTVAITPTLATEGLGAIRGPSNLIGSLELSARAPLATYVTSISYGGKGQSITREFALIQEQDLKVVRDMLEEFDAVAPALALTACERRNGRARIFARHSLFGEALKEFEGLAPHELSAAELSYVGELHLLLGDAAKAAEYFVSASERPDATLELKAFSAAAAGLTLRVTGDLPASESSLRVAVASFSALGDATSAQFFREKMSARKP